MGLTPFLTQFESNLGNAYLSSSFGDNVPASIGTPGEGNAGSGSTASPFRIYSTMDTNSGRIFVWMLNLSSNSVNQTADLHFPAAISGGTLYTLGISNTSPSFYNQDTYDSNNFTWLATNATWASGNSIVLTNPPATVTVGQFTLSSTPGAAQAPVITGVSPSMGQPGQIITVAGNNFSPNSQQNTVYFGPVKGIVTAAGSSSLSVQVPYGAAYAPVTVTVSNLTAYSTAYFNPAYYGASVTNPIVMQAIATNVVTNSLSTSGIVYPQDIVYFDADGDGRGDLAYLVNEPGIASIIPNDSSGSGNFNFLSTAQYPLPTTDDPTRMAFGDLDGDGLLDWVWIDYGLNTVELLRNASTPGNISFTDGGTYATGNAPYDVKIMDIDGDGRPDIIVANHYDNTVSVYRNLSTGTGNTVFAQKVDFPACPQPRQLAVADIDGDGKPDIVVVGDSTGITGSNVVVLWNLSTVGNLSFATPVAVGTNNVSESVAIGDFNGDGKLDLAVGAEGNRKVFIYVNASSVGTVSFGTGLWAANQTVTDPQRITVADFNGDGLPDFAVVGGSGTSSMYTFQNLFIGGSFTSTNFGSVTTSVTGLSPIAIISGDFDGDGRPDIAVGDFSSTNVVIFQNVSQY